MIYIPFILLAIFLPIGTQLAADHLNEYPSRVAHLEYLVSLDPSSEVVACAIEAQGNADAPCARNFPALSDGSVINEVAGIRLFASVDCARIAPFPQCQETYPDLRAFDRNQFLEITARIHPDSYQRQLEAQHNTNRMIWSVIYGFVAVVVLGMGLIIWQLSEKRTRSVATSWPRF